MGSYILRRCLYAVLILVGVNLLTFTLFFAVNSPDNIARLNIGGKRVTAEAIEQWKASHGYNKPLWFNREAAGAGKITDTIFFDRSLRLFTLDFGSTDSGRDLRHEIGTRILVSLTLAGPMLLLTVVVGIAFSLLLVFFRASYLDFWGTVLCVVMMSISSLFYIIMAQWFFGKMLKLVPLSGFVPGLSLLKFLALPIIVGIVFQLGSEARLFRAMLLEEANKDYVRTARSKGLSEAVVLFRHVLRNTWLPVLTHVSALLPYAFLGSIVFESFFGIPGLGTCAPYRQPPVPARSVSRSRQASSHVCRRARAPAGCHRADGLFGEIVAGRAELGLKLLLRRLWLLARHDQIGQFEIRCDAGKRRVERLLRHALCLASGHRSFSSQALELVVDLRGGGGERKQSDMLQAKSDQRRESLA